MSRSGHDSVARLTSPSSSRPTLQDPSPQPTNMTPLNILFLGETNMGEFSIIDLIAGQGEPKGIPRHADHCDDARSITLDSKLFMLHALPTSGSLSPAVLTEGIQRTLADLRRNGGIHLIVYCIHASQPTNWAFGIHRTINSYLTPPSRIPVVAVVSGLSDVALQESWWSRNEDAFLEQGCCFDDHAFIRVMGTAVQSPIISENRHALHALVLQNCADPFTSETVSDFQRGKSPSHTSTGSKTIDIVLLGEIGVGKSSLINQLAGENVAEVSSDTIGCTRATAMYTFEEKGRTFHLYDTPGLVDPQMGVGLFIDPIDTIQKLMRGLGNGSGPDLLLFCVNNGKPMAALQRNYRLFCKVICGGKVPFALAITKLEEGEDADQWWRQHRATIRRYGVDCSGHVGLGRKKHSVPNADLEGKLRESLFSFFIACTDRQKNKMVSLRSSMGRMVVSVASFLRAQALTPERALMNQCGLEEQIAKELVNRLASFKESYNDKMYT